MLAAGHQPPAQPGQHEDRDGTGVQGAVGSHEKAATHSGWWTRRLGAQAGRWWPVAVARPGGKRGLGHSTTTRLAPRCEGASAPQVVPHLPSLLTPPLGPGSP